MGVDRAALVRRAIVELIAERGLGGVSMGAVAERAGVATGTAYTYYGSKEQLLLAAYAEIKRGLGQAAVADLDADAEVAERFRRMWLGVHGHLAADPVRARFLVQVDSSPLGERAHAVVAADSEDPLAAVAASEEFAKAMVDLPVSILYELGLAPAVRLAAAGGAHAPATLDAVAAACWRAIAA